MQIPKESRKLLGGDTISENSHSSETDSSDLRAFSETRSPTNPIGGRKAKLTPQERWAELNPEMSERPKISIVYEDGDSS